MAQGNHAASPSVSGSKGSRLGSHAPGVHETGPDGPGTRAAVGSLWFWPGLLLVMIMALLVRSENLSGRPLDSMERAHFDAAGLGAITAGGSLAGGVKDDVAWAKRSLRVSRGASRGASGGDSGSASSLASSPGVLHGVTARMATRIGRKVGMSRVSSLRLFSMLFGVASVFVVAMLLRSTSPDEPLVALTGAAFAALQLGAVYGSRMGTGGAASAFFLLVMIYVGWRVFRGLGEHRTTELVGASALIAASSCAAYGFESDVKIYGAILAVAAVLLFRTGPRGVSKWPWYSKRTWAVLIGLAPLAALVWLGVGDNGGARDAESRSVAPSLLLHSRLACWPVFALTLLGLAGAFTRDMRWLIWLVLWAPIVALAYASESFHWMPSDAYYIAINLMGIVLAAEGAGVLWGLARDRVPEALADSAVIGTLLWMGLVTWSTTHGAGLARLAVQLP